MDPNKQNILCQIIDKLILPSSNDLQDIVWTYAKFLDAIWHHQGQWVKTSFKIEW